MRTIAAFLLCVPLIAAPGDILAIRVVGSATAVTDTESACNTATACTGWVAEIDVASLSTGGTYALGFASANPNFNPVAAKIVCTITGSGYNTSAALQSGTVTRTVYGTHQLRNIYNVAYTAPYPSDETLVSTTLTLRVALSDALYSGETATCNVGAGIYTQGGTPTNAATGVSVANNSTLTYSQAKVAGAWARVGYQRITSTTLRVGFVAFHRHAKDKRQVAAVEFIAADEHSHTASVVVNDMTIDTAMPDPLGKVQEYVGDLNLTAFTSGDVVTVNAKAYPWVSGACTTWVESTCGGLWTGDAVNTQPSPNYAPQYYIYDAAGTFGTSATVVDTAGNDTTCVAVSEATFNANPTSNGANSAPCLTARGAAVKMRAFNAANYTHADVTGAIYMKAGTYAYAGATTAISASTGTNPDAVWVTIQPFPGVARSAVIFNDVTTSGNRAGVATTKQRLYNVTIALTTGTPAAISGGSYIWFDTCDLTNTSGNTALVNGTSGGVSYWTWNTGGDIKTPYSASSNSVYPALHRGNIWDEITGAIVFYAALGNRRHITEGIATGTLSSGEGATVASQMPIAAFNSIKNIQLGAASAMSIRSASTTPVSSAFVGNILEFNSTGSGATANMGGATGTTNNHIDHYNTTVGGRTLWAYNDATNSYWLRTLWSDRFNFYAFRGHKSDTFSTPNAARLGNWFVSYGAGAIAVLDASTGISTGAESFKLPFAGIYSKAPYTIAASMDAHPSGEPPSADTTSATGYAAFVAYAALVNASTRGAGNGDYHLTAGSPLLNMVPSGAASMPYDFDGVARRNDGTGAIGAYEFASASSRKRVVITQ